MGVIDGTPVDAPTTNPAFVDSNADDFTTGKLDLNNNDPTVSGGFVVNIQKQFNSLGSWLGKSLLLAYNALPTFTNSQGLTATESILNRLEALSAKFHSSTGHPHDGSPGGGQQISAVSLVNVRLQGRFVGGVNILAFTGLSEDVSADFVAAFPSTGDAVQGVVVLPPNNRVVVRQATGANAGDTFVDGSGNIVYGRITEAAGVWTVSFFVMIGVTETPYNFTSSSNISYYYQQLYNPITNAPIYSELATIPSDNTTADTIDATVSQRGLINALAQTFGGIKTFFNNIILSARLYFATTLDSATTGANATIPLPATSAVRLTNALLTSVQGVSGGTDGAYLILINRTGADVDILNEVGTGANQIETGTGADFTWKDKAAIVLYYEGTTQKWYLAGGGGSSAQAYQEVPTGVVDGINDTFTLSETPVSVDSLLVIVDGTVIRKSFWALVGNDVVFNPGSIPALAQDVYVYYAGAPGGGGGGGLSPATEYRTLSAGEITAKQLTLTGTPSSPSNVLVDVIGGTSQEYNVDFTVSGSIVGWNGTPLDGLLSAGDKLRIHYYT